jgi:hypothetical protein
MKMEKMRMRTMDQILVRMTKAKKPMGAKSLQEVPCQARGKGTMKILAMETTNFLQGMISWWYSQVPCKGFSCRMLYGGSLLCRNLCSFSRRNLPKGFSGSCVETP